MVTPAEALARVVLGHMTLNVAQKLADAGFDFDQINSMAAALVPEWNRTGNILREKFAALLGEDIQEAEPMIASAAIVCDGEKR
jgi:hypothetical protein